MKTLKCCIKMGLTDNRLDCVENESEFNEGIMDDSELMGSCTHKHFVAG